MLRFKENRIGADGFGFAFAMAVLNGGRMVSFSGIRYSNWIL
jgi:hypothetical protein